MDDQAQSLWIDAVALAELSGPHTLPAPEIAQARARTGRHPHRQAGAGQEFWQYRPLTPGEPVDRLDWRRSARGDEFFQRTHERETKGRLWLWLEPSPALAYRSSPALPRKGVAAAVVLAAVGAVVETAEEEVTTPSGGLRLKGAQAALHALLLQGSDWDGWTPAPLHDWVLLAGDFLDDRGLTLMADLAHAGVCGALLHWSDPAERLFPFADAVRLHDPGTPDLDLPQAREQRAAYLAAWAAHEERLHQATNAAGWIMVACDTGAPLDQALADTLDALEARPC